ncbi:MAG: 50S ribosomal protein L10 [bacterium]|nr:50S ribosomal protein L10 [bacterium]
MSLTREQKGKIIADLEEKFNKANSLIFTDFTGLSVAKTREFRKKLKGFGAALKVAKKTLIRRALKYPAVDGIVGPEGKAPVSIIFGGDNIAELAKTAYNFAKTESLKILGGILGGRFLDSGQIVELAKLPAREQLLAMLLRAIQAPTVNLVGVMQANLRNLVCALDAIKNKKS